MSLASPQAVWQKVNALRQVLDPVTVLLIGICIQSLLVSFVPSPYVLLPVASYLAYRGILTALVTFGFLPNPLLSETDFGLAQATFPLENGSMPENTISPDSGSDRGVVLFVVGCSINHPAGKLAPGAQQTLDYFDNNWTELEANREKWGFLGRTPLLTGKTETGGIQIMAISYWKDLEHLAEFSRSPFHRAGMGFVGTKMRKWRYLGLMHETYVVPKGHWENLYYYSPPVGLGLSKFLVEPSKGKEGGYMGPLVKAKPGIGFKRLQSSVVDMQFWKQPTPN